MGFLFGGLGDKVGLVELGVVEGFRFAWGVFLSRDWVEGVALLHSSD